MEDSGGTPAFLMFSTRNAGNVYAERMRITSAGNVGIGTSSATSPLTVYAQNSRAVMTVTNGPSANNAGITLESAGGNVILNNGNGPFELSVGGSQVVTVTTAGNVGLGTNAPAYKLDGYGASQFRPTTNVNGNAAWFSIGSIQEASGFGAAIGMYVDNAVTNSYSLTFGTKPNSATAISERMRIDPSGNLLIGQTTSVQGIITAAGTIASVDASLAYLTQMLSAAGVSTIAAYSATGQALAFNTTPSGGGATERMRIDASGNVSIGTTAAAQKLNLHNGYQLITNTTTGTSQGLLIGLDTGDAVMSNQYNGALKLGTNNTERARIDANGNLLLGGTSTPGTKVIYIANATAAPATNPTGGGVLYVEGGALKYRGSSGTVTTIANA